MRKVLVALALISVTVANVEAQDDRAQALAMFEEGVAEYEEGRFEAAAELFRRANAVYPEPVLLYNLARAEESLGHLEAAAESYRAYLGSDPGDRAAVEARLRIIDTRLQEQQSLEDEAAEQAERAARAEEAREVAPPSRSTAGPITLISIGGVSAIAGGALVAIGQIRGGGVNDPERPLDEASDQRDGAVRLNRAGFVVGSMGVAILIGGIAWLMGARSDDGDALAFRF